MSSAISGGSFCRRTRLRKSHGDGALGGVLADDVFVELDDNFARSHVVERGQQFLLLGGRGAIGAGREYHFFVGLDWHRILLNYFTARLPTQLLNAG